MVTSSATTGRLQGRNNASSALSPVSSTQAALHYATRDPESLLDSLDQRNKNSGEGASAFDPVEFLNQHYESEKVLAQQLPTLREAVSRRIEGLNDRIANALQRQSETAASTRRHIQGAKASCEALEHRILQVREKAAMSERAVLEITADMKRLDCAKRHLQRTITTLKRLHMLVQAVEHLRIASSAAPPTGDSNGSHTHPDYRNASHLVVAITELLQYFEPYSEKVQPLQVLCGKIEEYQKSLKASLMFDFRVAAFGKSKALILSRGRKGKSRGNESKDDTDDLDDSTSRIPPTVLEGGAMLVDALGTGVRREFIHNFCQDSLGEYLTEFEPPSRKPPSKPEEKRISSFKKVEAKAPDPPSKSQAGLDNIEKRFTWFLNGPMLSVKTNFQQVIPTHWNLQAYLVGMFLQLTRDHILALLDGPRKDPDAANATILLKALQKTILFEKDISSWLERECGTVFDPTVESLESSDGTKSAIKPLIGRASVAYQNYMTPYIKLEEQSMDELLAQALDDRIVDTRGERPVFISSTNLFVYIKGSITRCTALTKGYALFLLYRAFKSSLKNYAQILSSKLPPPLTNQLVSGISFGNKQDKASSASTQFNIPIGEEVTVCHVISTCEYCADTMEALEDLIRDTVDDEFKAKIDMMSDQEQFHDITAKSIRILVSGLTNRMENALKEMSAMNWASWEVVGEESAYVLLIHEQTIPFVKTVKQLLPTSYFRSFCDKFATSFSSSYNEQLMRQKKISDPGTQQLLLDLYNLKTLFLKIPVLEDSTALDKKTVPSGASIAPAMYTKIVQKHFGRLETILKLVGTPLNLLIDNFKVQWIGGTASDLTLIMSLKGMKRTEQAVMLEKLGYDPVQAMKGAAASITSATIVTEHVQLLQDQGQNVAAKVNSDLNQMRQKVDEFRKTFR